MGIDKPFFRVARIENREDTHEGYMLDARYANDRVSLCQAYKLIVNDLEKLFEYVEPCNSNLSVFSHRIYELLLRASTEFENNCKQILLANGYPVNPQHMHITDYYYLEQVYKLSEYEVLFDTWTPSETCLDSYIKLKPFEQFNNEKPKLQWYEAYNQVKHNRNKEFFKEASLNNMINAVAALFVILFCQFGINIFTNKRKKDSEEDAGFIHTEGSIFGIKVPKWPDKDKYSLNKNIVITKAEWETIPDPFRKFIFKNKEGRDIKDICDIDHRKH